MGVADIAVAVVHGQFAAEVSCEDELTVRVPATGEVLTWKPGRYFVNAEGGTVNLGSQKLGARAVRFSVKEDGKPIEVNKKAYRGSFEVRIAADGKTLDVVNILPLEQYLYSVVGEEIPVIFPDEAIKAQAVASRSLAYNMAGSRASQGYDLKASEEGQDYYGIATEKPADQQAGRRYCGLVVTYNGQADRGGVPRQRRRTDGKQHRCVGAERTVPAQREGLRLGRAHVRLGEGHACQ